jgi:hypothetical protein
LAGCDDALSTLPIVFGVPTEILAMKRLLTLTAVALLMCATTGCECCGIGSMGGLFSRRRECGSCSPCRESCAPVIETPSGCGCGCGGGAAMIEGTPTLGAPSVSPETYSFVPRK